MPYKIGGGKQLKFYSQENGEYSSTNENHNSDIEHDLIILKNHLKGIYNENVYFPDGNISSKEYCIFFVKYIRSYISNIYIDEKKYDYLLTEKEKNDKSNYLYLCGFTKENVKELDTLLKNIDFQKLEYSRMVHNALLCTYNLNVEFNNNSYLLICVYELKHDLTLRLVTIVPGGKK